MTGYAHLDSDALVSAIVSVLVSACGAFLFTDPSIRQWWNRTVSRIVGPLATFRLRDWLGVAAALVAMCALLNVGRGVWLWATNRELLVLKKNMGDGYSVAFSPDGKWLAVAGTRLVRTHHDTSTLMIWDTTDGTNKYFYFPDLHSPTAYCVSFSPDGKWLAVGSTQESPPVPRAMKGAAIQDDDKSPVPVLDATTGEVVLRLKGDTSAEVRGIAFSPDGGQLATGGTDGIVKFWDLKTCTKRLALKKQHSEINSVAFSPDGTQLVTCDSIETVMIFDTNTGAEIKTLRMGTPRELVVSYWRFHVKAFGI
jgi:WD40 repeat protein